MLKTNGASQCYLNFLLVKIYIPHSTYDSCKNDLPIFFKKEILILSNDNVMACVVAYHIIP